MRRVFILSFLCLGFFSSAFAQDNDLFKGNTYSAPFIAVSDIHFDPFLECSKVVPCPLIKQLNSANAAEWEAIFAKNASPALSPYGEDSNYSLLQSTLHEVQKQIQEYRPKFIVMPGDFLAHDMQKKYEYFSGDRSLQGYQNFIKKDYQFLAGQIQKYWGNVPVYIAIGNNDSYNGDYAVDVEGQFYADLAKIWAPLLKDKSNEILFADRFPTGGYYEITVPGESHHKIIVINSVLFSKNAKGKNIDEAAQQQLTWLTERLREAEIHQHKVWLLFHIPIGMDVYNVANNPLHPMVSFWQPLYTKAFQQIIDNFPYQIEGIIVAHTHMDGFYLLNQHPNKIAQIFIPSISPRAKNNPAFKIFSYSPRSFYLQNFAVFNLPLNVAPPVWNLEYIFNTIYQPDCKNCLLDEGAQTITKDGAAAKSLQQYFESGSPNHQPINEGKWLPYYWCGINNITLDDYKTCLKAASAQ